MKHKATKVNAVIKRLGKLIFGVHAFNFLLGASLTAAVLFTLMANFEDGLYDQIVARVTEDSTTETEKAIVLMNTTHELLKPRLAIFSNQKYLGIRDTFLRSSDIQLLDAKGACGTHSHVLARLLQRAGIPSRIGQMQGSDGGWGCHIYVEAQINGEFVVMDPSFNTAFRTEDGNLASFADLKNDWETLNSQLPGSYDRNSSYRDVRYTNWNKVPIVMPAVREILRLFIGDEVSELSLRSMVLNKYRFFANTLFVFLTILVSVSLLVLRRRLRSRSTSEQVAA